MAESESKKDNILKYKGKQVVRSGDTIYYGDLSEPYIARLTVKDSKDFKDLKVSGEIQVEIVESATVKPGLKGNVVRKGKKEGLYNALSVGSVWLASALRMAKSM